jgi:pimeloyl-ACP methyl ester carboxylesterase
MQVNGVGVLVEGDGAETILLLHGWPDTHRLWDAQVAALKGQYRCIRFTLPGFEPGARRQSFTLDRVIEMIRQVIEQTAGGLPVTLLLHDWGCFFGYQFALRHPQLVQRVIGIDVGDAGSRRHVQSLSLKAKAQIAGYQGWLAVAFRIGGTLGDRMARFMAQAGRAPADPASVHANMGWPYWLAWTGGFRGAKLFTPHCPMLFVYGTRKPFTFHSPAWAADIAGRPGSRVEAFDCGHWVMVQRRDALNAVMLAWLRAGSAGAGA